MTHADHDPDGAGPVTGAAARALTGRTLPRWAPWGAAGAAIVVAVLLA